MVPMPDSRPTVQLAPSRPRHRGWTDAVLRTGSYALTRTALSEWYNE